MRKPIIRRNPVVLAVALSSILSTAFAAEPAAPADNDQFAFSRLEKTVPLSGEQPSKIRTICERAVPGIAALKAEHASLLTRQSEAIMTADWAAFSKLYPSNTKGRAIVRFLQTFPKAEEAGVTAAKTALSAMLPRAKELQAAIRDVDARLAAAIDARDSAIAAVLREDQKKAFEGFRASMKHEREAARIESLIRAWAKHPAVAWPAERLALVGRLDADLFSAWSRAWKAKDIAAFESLLHPKFEGTLASEPGVLQDDGLFQRRAAAPAPAENAAAAAARAKTLLDRFSTVEAVDVDLLQIDDKDGAATVNGRLSVRGRDAGGKRVEFYALADVETAPVAGKERMRGLRLREGMWIASAATEPVFEDRTRAAGLDKLPVYVRNEAIRRGGYALAMSDYDGDGCVDMYAGTEGPGQLLKGDCKGGFADVTKSAGLGDDRLVKSAVFADFNGDGRQDLLVVRFEYSPTKQLALYEGRPGGKFRRAKEFDFAGFAHYDYSLPMPIAVGDFNGDRKLDFYVGFPGKLDFTTMAFEDGKVASSARNRYNGHPQGLFFGKGGFAFEDKTDYALYRDASYAQRMKTIALYPHSAVAFDMNGDGKQDLFVVDDRMNPSPVFRNNGDGTFEQVAERVGIDHPQWGMSVAVGDFSNRGVADLYVTNINFRETMAFNSTDGNRFYRNRGDGTYEDASEKSGLRFVGEAPGGATAVDFDNDGRQDLFVVNGLWTGAGDKRITAEYLLAWQGMRVSKVIHETLGMKSPLVEDVALAINDVDLGDSGQAVMRLLKDARDEQGRPRFSLGGHQRNRLFRNNGDGTFTDVSYVSGLDAAADGYVAAVADVFGDGGQDLVLRNADPGTPEHTFAPLQLFKNNAAKGRKHLSLRLVGVESNPDAIGAQATVVGRDGLKQYRELIANNGAAQDERAIHFGLGATDGVKTLAVRWPSGKTQTFEDVAAGAYRLKEGGTLERDRSRFPKTALNR
ncbi:MAG: CRTAC1 family protein [Elusimicrobia bacterium]|nr:CRTAC1 family protein [Elusimicrobiota bacterium]